MKEETLLESFYYGYEDGADIERDVVEAIEKLTGEWMGTVKVTITYDPAPPSEKEE